MTVSLGFDTNQISAVSDQLTAAAAAIQDELDHLDEEVKLLSGRWTGEAQASYDAAHRQWTQNMDQMRAILEACAKVAERAARDYAAAERAATAFWT